ncbi:DNA repair protein RecN [Snodgrassella communis]|uniref:DNA repair protein RecN n=1 Tax=Snodgrassella communis TaxID=2946699 RepID=A0A066TU81_9NEIS|nr:DNA repair protein RecN [Snodgrassella communis]KDN12435.1 DNA repair protein RecN [Snodgrassella communis]KDN15573.1 DNA repair protein RecN [Snodgrassella communis]PIT07234.1 DNA repair protein RecN [Snodgrassella communis]PIT26033.1 DNA repair protein RecN [Snodgrassella communis]PIT27629.1 DNA repair protein RecN [Snodgrassella communis]
MLLALSLRDFVIVDELNLSFQGGFTVLTGETGAGKSITLDALGLLLGDKADYGQIRHGAKEAQLSALFDVGDVPQACVLLQEQGLLAEHETQLSIRRIIDVKGKSRSFINNQAVTLGQLRQIGELLIDIHGQNAHHSLNSEAAQRVLLDAFAGADKEVAQVREAYQRWHDAERELEKAQTQADSLNIERERLQWRFDELNALNLQENEWDTLSQSHDALVHAADILHTAASVEEIINGDDGLQSRLYHCRQQLAVLANAAPAFADSVTLLESVEAELGEVSAYLREASASVETDENLLAQQGQRMQELMSVARKYRLEPPQLPEELAKVAAALNELEASADIEALHARVAERKNEYMQAAQQLSAKRHQAAKKLAKQTTAHMQNLAMQGARFNIELLSASPSLHGLEQVQYQVAANQGTPLRAMSKVASGGELARISLALQMVTSQYNAVPTLIFDEVDTGIGGAVADVVGHALRSLGQNRQILAVTHLPQVAACGQQHWQVRKHSSKGQTFSEIKVLTSAERVDEIARMLGGETITDTTRNHAKEMLELAQD